MERTEALSSIRNFFASVLVVTALFGAPLWRLFQFAAGDELFSYIVLIPVISVYLGWLDRKKISVAGRPAGLAAGCFVVLGTLFLGWYLKQPPAQGNDALCVVALSYVCFVTGSGCVFLGGAAMRVLAFSFFLLIFLLPFPQTVLESIETFLQHGSAEVADWMFTLSGMSYVRSGLEFKLPGIALRVAPECSGIHSTVVLFITSLVAGKMLLSKPGNRAILALFVVPLALARNAFRIFVLGELCVHVGPHMIDSPIHHRGGPLFFGLSLLPFFGLLFYLRKSENKKRLGESSDAKK